jgi:tetratricopeptide (TPR) repeat protein
MSMSTYRTPLRNSPSTLPIGTILIGILFAGCISPSFPEKDRGPDAQTSGSPEAGLRAGLEATGVDEAAEEATEPALRWNELTRLARDHTLRKEWEEASQRLDQAERQVAALAPGHVRRRTVFGLQARLAASLAEAGEVERADALASHLFGLAEENPEIAGPALIELARSTAARHLEAPGADAEEARSESLRLQETALRVAASQSASSGRLELAAALMEEAYYAGRTDLARRAADQAINDARILSPSRLSQLASLHLERARIAAAEQDFATAEKDARTALDFYQRDAATETFLGMADATLAEVLMQRGSMNEAIEALENAEARLRPDNPIHPHARRIILGARARISNRLGEKERAQSAYREALAIPGEAFEADRYLVERLRVEFESPPD